MPSLILIKSPGGLASGQSYPMSGDSLVIGREEGCWIVIPNNAVSRKHAQVIRANGQYILEDLKSRNKTYLNNQEVGSPTPLRNDDRIKICDYLFRFHDEKTAPVKPIPPRRNPLLTESEDDAQDTGPEASEGNTTVAHTVGRGAAEQFLSAQPSDRLRVLLDVSTSLSRSLELEPLLPKIADTLFGVFKQADRCFIILIDPDTGRLVPKAVKSRRPGGDDERFSKTIVRKCLESGQAYVSEDASSDAALGAAMSIAAIQIRSAMCVPMMAVDNKPLGAIQVDTHDFTKKFKEDDLKMLQVVANLAAVSVERAQMLSAMLDREKQQKEIEIAKSVQLGFLPQTTPEIDCYEFYAYYSAAQTVGGDYYDFIQLPGGKIAAVLGDVAGKGVPASLLMAKLSAEARFCFLTQPDAGKAVQLLNDQLIRGGIGDRFVTLAALILDPVENTVTVVNAGHINPQRYRINTGELFEAITDAESGVPLGLMPGYEYQAKTLPLETGEALLLFTDGVTDANNPAGEMFGFDGIRKSLADDSVFVDFSPRAVGDRLVKGVRRHAAGRAQNDDIAVVCFGRVESSGQATGVNLGARLTEFGSGIRPAPGGSGSFGKQGI